MRSIIEIFLNGKWVPAAEFTPRGGAHRASFEYLMEYVFGDDPVPLSLALPVTAERLPFDGEHGAPACPPFLLDLVPQGRGRRFLLDELKLPNNEDADLVLAQHGAFNPVGNLRADTAVAFYNERRRQHKEEGRGFSFEEIIKRPEAFRDHIWLHEMLSAGTAVQGAAPKFLLTQSTNGAWFADAAIDDAEATSHWLVKMPRGQHESDMTVLVNEAAYLRVAERCGLRVEGRTIFAGNMLFLPRFDRIVVGDGRVQRLHQETLSSLAGLFDHGLQESLFTLVEALQGVVSDPVGEIVEFIKRDVLNVALRNPDNHARNTSVQRLPDGTIRLTPLYDFAPMYLDREFITRGCRWRKPEGGEFADWTDIVEALTIAGTEKRVVLTELRNFASTVANLPEIMMDCDVESAVIEDCKPFIEAQFHRLQAIKDHGPTP